MPQPGLVPAYADTDGTLEPEPIPVAPAPVVTELPTSCAERIVAGECPVLEALAFESGRRRQLGEIIRRRAQDQVYPQPVDNKRAGP